MSLNITPISSTTYSDIVLTPDYVMSPTISPVIHNPTDTVVISSPSPVLSPYPYTHTHTVVSEDPLIQLSPGYTGTVVTSPLVLSEQTPHELYSPVVLSSEPYPGSPLKQTINMTYSRPLVSLYTDLNSDPDTQKRMVRYLHLKALDDWLQGDLSDILNYFKVYNGKVDVIKSKSEYNPNNKDSQDVINKKIDFIEKYFLTKRYMVKLVTEFINKTGFQWVDIPKHKFFFKQLLKDEMMKMIKKSLK